MNDDAERGAPSDAAMKVVVACLAHLCKMDYENPDELALEVDAAFREREQKARVEALEEALRVALLDGSQSLRDKIRALIAREKEGKKKP